MKKKNKFIIALFSLFSFFVFNSNVSAKVYYDDINFSAVGTDLNIFEEIMSVSGESNAGKNNLAKKIMELGGGMINYFSDIYNSDNATNYVFDAIGFFEPDIFKDFILTSYVSADDYIASLGDEAKYLVLLYNDPSLTYGESSDNGSYFRIYHNGVAILVYDKDMNLLGDTFIYEVTSGSNRSIYLWEDKYNEYLKNVLYANDDGEMVSSVLANHDVTPLLQLLFATADNYVIPFSSSDSSDRFVIEHVYLDGKQYNLTNNENYGWWKEFWADVHDFWFVGDNYENYHTFSLNKYRANPYATKSTGFVTPADSIFNLSIDGVDSSVFEEFEVIDVSSSKYGYFFVPISDIDYTDDVEFYFYKTNAHQSLYTASYNYMNDTNNLDLRSIYLSYILTTASNQTYHYYPIYGGYYTRDINLSTSLGISYTFDYKSHVIYMFTDYTNGSLYVYYDPNKYKVVSYDYGSKGDKTFNVYSYTIKYNHSKLYDTLKTKVAEYVGYDGELYDLGSVAYDGVLDNGYDNWKDCVENECIENSVGIFDDPTDTNLWEKDGWSSLDDIIDGAWDGISGLLGSVSAVVAMFNILFTGLPPLISSTFLLIFVISMTLILLKILL